MDKDNYAPDAPTADTTFRHTRANSNALTSSHEISWPIEEHTNETSLSSNRSSQSQRVQFSSEEDHLMRQRANHRKSTSSINDNITKDKYSESQLDSTEYQRTPNKYNHRQGPGHPDPIVRVLDRPLLDLDDDECFDAIEVERQKSNDSWFEDTECSKNPRNYQTDPKPDPLPDPSPKGSRKLSPKGSRRLSYATPGTNNVTDAPEGATEEELQLLNHFIDVASSNFNGNILSADSESRVRAAALKVGLTSKFVDQLLNQTMNQTRENPSSGLTFVPSEQPSTTFGSEQKSVHDKERDYIKDDFHMQLQRERPNYATDEYGGDNATNDAVDHSRRRARERRRNESTADNFSVWDSLGKSFGLLANMTARACGVEYHSRRDDASSVVSAISWDDDNTPMPKSRKVRTERQSVDTSENYNRSFPVDHHGNDKTQQRVTFASHCKEEGEKKVRESNNIQNDTGSPPRPKITQLV